MAISRSSDFVFRRRVVREHQSLRAIRDHGLSPRRKLLLVHLDGLLSVGCLSDSVRGTGFCWGAEADVGE